MDRVLHWTASVLVSVQALAVFAESKAPPHPAPKLMPAPQMTARCKSLVAYRDGQLVRDWDNAAKTFNRASDTLPLIRRVRDEVKPYARYSDAVQALGLMSHATKTTANMILNILRMNPGADSTVGAALDAYDERMRATKFGMRVNKAIQANGNPEQVRKVLMDEAVDYTTKIIQRHAPVIGPAIKAVYQFEEDMRATYAFAKGSAGLTRELEKRLSALDSQVRSLDSELKRARQQLNAVNATKNAIDKECNAHATPTRLS